MAPATEHPLVGRWIERESADGGDIERGICANVDGLQLLVVREHTGEVERWALPPGAPGVHVSDFGAAYLPDGQR